MVEGGKFFTLNDEAFVDLKVEMLVLWCFNYDSNATWYSSV
jgi:hypothetical protein